MNALMDGFREVSGQEGGSEERVKVSLSSVRVLAYAVSSYCVSPFSNHVLTGPPLPYPLIFSYRGLTIHYFPSDARQVQKRHPAYPATCDLWALAVTILQVSPSLSPHFHDTPPRSSALLLLSANVLPFKVVQVKHGSVCLR